MPAPAKRTAAKATRAKVAEPVNKVDETVENQMNPGVNMVDRSAGPQIVTNASGVAYDISKSAPELVVEDRSEEKNRIRQQEAALNPAEWREESDKEYTTVYFVDTGLSTSKVWKKGEELKVEKGQEFDWMNLSADEQKERYGRVMFERR